MPKLLLKYAKSYRFPGAVLILLIVAQGSLQLFGLTREMKRIVDQGIQAGDMSYMVFFPGEGPEKAEIEEMISHVVFETGLPVVIPYYTVEVEGGRYGIVYETLGAKTLSETIEEDPERFDEWISEYVKLYRLVHETDGTNTVLPFAKDVYRKHLSESADWYSKEEMSALLKLLDSIPDQNTMIHGDFHPNNIMVNDGIMIDLGDFSIGHPVFDFLATAATQANLVELSPEYAEFHTKMKAERIRKGWTMLLDRYFPDRTPEELRKIDKELRLLSRLKVACAPAVAKGISRELMQSSVDDVKINLIPHIDELIGTIDW
ncbi:MAG: phosphotransferase [Lachnospiraceae bacterium]|nr:phosphotransferase [Lachnospiraceae bacterium]